MSAKPPSQVTRNAVCEHCGYHLTGTAIVDGFTQCPECGKLSALTITSPDNHARERSRGFGFMLAATLFILAVGIPIAFMIPGWATLILVFALGVAVLATAPRLIRRALDM
ncbi:MAG: hypothetical protein D6695_06200 [Planctomycetota bacterium]|nr:MAG: hypothetical protein D6695_06200 [Planctomycetota bacterium]